MKKMGLKMLSLALAFALFASTTVLQVMAWETPEEAEAASSTVQARETKPSVLERIVDEIFGSEDERMLFDEEQPVQKAVPAPSGEVETPSVPYQTHTEDPTNVVESGNCGKDGDNVKWELHENGALYLFGNGDMENYSDYGYYCSSPFFKNTSIKYSIIENGVTSIGTYAFKDCTELTSIEIPNSVIHIYKYAFEGCTGLTNIEIPHSVTSVGGGAFSDCTSLKYITTGIIDSNLPLRKAETIVLTDSVSSIENYAFEGCTALTNIVIPTSVTSVGLGAFYGCDSLKHITTGIIDSNIPFSIAETIVLTDSVTSIGDSAFYRCLKLTSIDIPDSVTSIGDSAFIGCTGLTSIDIPDSVTSIGNSAFSGCTGLTSIDIPDSVTSIGNSAFSGCNGLTSIDIPDNVTSIGSSAFSGCTGLTSIEIPNSVTSIGSGSFSCCGLTNINLPDSVTDIGDFAFNYCTGLTNINLPERVTSIGNYAFRECTGLTNINLPDSVTSIGNYAFNGCTGLTNINLPDSVTSIGNYAFSGCTGLTSIEIPDNVTSIGDHAFDGCTGLVSLEIGKSVTIVGDLPFEGCTGVKYIKTGTIEPFNIPIEDLNTFIRFLPLKNVEKIVLTDSVSDIPWGSFFHCENLKSVEIPDSVKSIGDLAFDGCTGLTSIDIPNSVTSIGRSAFYDCTGLTNIHLPDSITSIGDGVFYGCTSIENVTIDTSNVQSMSVLAKAFKYMPSTVILNHTRKILNYEYIDSPDNQFNHAAISVETSDEIDFSSKGGATSYYYWGGYGKFFNNGFRLDRVQEIKDNKGNIYAVCGDENRVVIIPKDSEQIVTVEKEGFMFGAATIDSTDNLYILWGKRLTDPGIDSTANNKDINLFVLKYDLKGNFLGECGIPLVKTWAQYPFDAGNASILVKDDILGCFFDTKWASGHQGSEFAAVNIKTMELVDVDGWEGSHSFGLSMIPTEYGFAAIQMGDAIARGINFNSYFVSGDLFELSYISCNGEKQIYHSNGKYGSNENQLDGNTTYTHMGGLAESNSTYAIAGKSNRVYTSDVYYTSELKSDIYDVFVKIVDQTLVSNVNGLAGVDRIDEATGEIADRNVVWLTECNEREKAGEVKVVTLKDGSYCVLWEKYIDDVLDSVHYVILDECGNIIRRETKIANAQLSSTSIQPIVQGDTLTWAVADGDSHTLTWYSVDINEFTDYTPGDINGDGKVNMKDLTRLHQYINGWDVQVVEAALDINGDGKVNMKDLTRLHQYLNGWDVKIN